MQHNGFVNSGPSKQQWLPSYNAAHTRLSPGDYIEYLMIHVSVMMLCQHSHRVASYKVEHILLCIIHGTW